jgi:hypothetical protein
MTPDDFRRLALSFAETSENAHMSHPDFRVGGKIFASLGYPGKAHGMVVLPPDEQKKLMASYPRVFAPANGAWGKRGSTTVYLDAVKQGTLRSALEIAWRNRSAKKKS